VKIFSLKSSSNAPLVSARKFLLVTALFLIGAKFVAAIPLREYRENVSRAAVLLTAVETRESEMTDAENTVNVRATLADVRRLVPPQQKVEFADDAFEADNRWLEKDLQTFEKLAASDAERGELLGQIADRLAAIENRVYELETAQTATAANSKNDDKAKLDEILNRPEFQKPAEREKSVLEKWLETFEKWLQELFRRSEPNSANAPNTSGASSLGALLSYGVMVLAGAIIVIVVWRFLLPLAGGNRRRKKRERREPRIILGEQIAADASSDDLLAEAENLAHAGDVRAAIRKGYIALLCELSDRKILGLARHKTNRDYLRDVKKTPELHRPMRDLTGSFEEHWYGSKPADESDWSEFRGKYKEVLQSK
jgi:hypothetical protein